MTLSMGGTYAVDNWNYDDLIEPEYDTQKDMHTAKAQINLDISTV